MFKKRIPILLALFVSLGMIYQTSCTKDVVVTDVCFQNDVLPIFVSKCSMSGCHSTSNAGGKNEGNHGYDLTSYGGIMKGVVPKKTHQSSIYSNCVGINPSMPPKQSTQLTREELSTIKVWINQGAPNSTCQSNSCDTSLFTYSSSVANIIKVNCAGCHNASNSSGSVNLATYATTFTALNNTNFLKCMQHQSGVSAMPPSYKIDNCSLTKVEKWIQAGAPNN